MDSQPYDPKADSRDCYLARFVPLESITNADVDGVTVGVASKSQPRCGYLVPLGHELIDSSCCRHTLPAWVQVLARISYTG